MQLAQHQWASWDLDLSLRASLLPYPLSLSQALLGIRLLSLITGPG